MEWGTELWDKYTELANLTKAGIDHLETTSSLIKDRSRIEAEYAKNLRSLVQKYSPKEPKVRVNANAQQNPANGPMSIMSINTTPEEEYTHIKAFKKVLEEIGFQAGQHEVKSEYFSKEITKTLHEQAKRLKERRKKILKEADEINENLNKCFKSMAASKEKFRKALEEHEKAKAAFDKANQDGSVSRNELEKLRLLAGGKSSQSDSMQQSYASHIIKTNEAQQKYYYNLLPNILNQLQDLERSRIEHFRDSLKSCAMKEINVAPIINGCSDTIIATLDSILPDVDTEIVIDRLKSGDVPPGDFKLEDMRDSHAMLRTDTLADNKATNFNLYQKKRELEKHISGIQQELSKSNKERESFLKMEATLRSNPKFGDSSRIQGEMGKVNHKIMELERVLRITQSELNNVESKLGELRTRSPRPPLENGLRISPTAMSRSSRSDSSNDSGSIKSSSLSIGSSAMITNSPGQVVYDIPENELNQRLNNDDNDDWTDDEMPLPPPPSTGLERNQIQIFSASPSVISTSSSSMSTTGSSSLSSISYKHCIAVYDYHDRQSMENSNIPIDEGEELIIVEDDVDGWTKVRRLIERHDEQNEGYVPTSYLKAK